MVRARPVAHRSLWAPAERPSRGVWLWLDFELFHRGTGLDLETSVELWRRWHLLVPDTRKWGPHGRNILVEIEALCVFVLASECRIVRSCLFTLARSISVPELSLRGTGRSGSSWTWRSSRRPLGSLPRTMRSCGLVGSRVLIGLACGRGTLGRYRFACVSCAVCRAAGGIRRV